MMNNYSLMFNLVNYDIIHFDNYTKSVKIITIL